MCRCLLRSRILTPNLSVLGDVLLRQGQGRKHLPAMMTRNQGQPRDSKATPSAGWHFSSFIYNMTIEIDARPLLSPYAGQQRG